MSDNNQNRIRAIAPAGDGVIKGSNLPTPMGMAPSAPTNSTPQTTEPQAPAASAPVTDTITPQQSLQPQPDSTDASS